MATGFCSTCKRATRGGFAAHSATKGHRAAIRRANTRSDSKMAERSGSGARRGRAARAASRSQDVYYAANTVRVRTYKRRRPMDGPRKTVKVVHHYRMRAPRAARGWREGVSSW